MNSPAWRVLCIGNLSMNKFWGEGDPRRAPHSTSVLIEAGGVRIVVDPSWPPDQIAEILDRRRGIQPDDIDFVFLTHRHGDHCSGLEAFAAATRIMAARAIVHDAAGNVTSYVEGDGTPTWTFTYDYRNRVVTASNGVTTTTYYYYDAFNRRVEKDLETGTDVLYLYDGWQCVEEREWDDGDTAWEPRRQYVFGSQYIDEPLIFDKDTGTDAVMDAHYYYCQQANYNVVAVTSTAGVIVDKVKYDPYGEATFDTGGTIGNPYLFQGRRWDSDADLYYFRNRDYDPELGRFVQRDPAGYGDGMNLYQYTVSNPVINFDPLGLKLRIRKPKTLPWSDVQRNKERYAQFKGAVEDALVKLCSLAYIDEAGNVGMAEGPPREDEMEACCCLMELINNNFDNEIYGPAAAATHAEDTVGASTPGTGSAARVGFNPDAIHQERSSPQDPWQVIPNEIVLGHELCGHLVDFNMAWPSGSKWTARRRRARCDEASGAQWMRRTDYGGKRVYQSEITPALTQIDTEWN